MRVRGMEVYEGTANAYINVWTGDGGCRSPPMKYDCELYEAATRT